MRTLRKTLLLPLFFMLLIGTASAVGCDSLPTSQVTTPATALSLSLLALILSFFVIAIAYIVGALIPASGIKEWIQSEWWETAKTAMLIGGIYAAITLLSGMAAAVSYAQVQPIQQASTTPGPFYLVQGACTYLLKFGFGTNSSYLNESYAYLLGLANWLGLLQSIHIGLFLPIDLVVVNFRFGVSAPIYVNGMLESFTFYQYQSILNDVLKFIISPVSLLFSVQSALLPSIFGLGLAVFIPIGLFFRAFPFLRSIGGTLVAIGIGLALVYPALLLLFNYPVSIALQNTAYQSTPYQCQFGIFCGFTQALTGGSAGIQAAGDAFSSFYTIFPALNGIIHYTVFLTFQFILFLLDAAIGYPIVDGIAKALGGTIRLSLGHKLKLL